MRSVAPRSSTSAGLPNASRTVVVMCHLLVTCRSELGRGSATITKAADPGVGFRGLEVPVNGFLDRWTPSSRSHDVGLLGLERRGGSGDIDAATGCSEGRRGQTGAPRRRAIRSLAALDAVLVWGAFGHARTHRVGARHGRSGEYHPRHLLSLNRSLSVRPRRRPRKRISPTACVGCAYPPTGSVSSSSAPAHSASTSAPYRSSLLRPMPAIAPSPRSSVGRVSAIAINVASVKTQ